MRRSEAGPTAPHCRTRAPHGTRGRPGRTRGAAAVVQPVPRVARVSGGIAVTAAAVTSAPATASRPAPRAAANGAVPDTGRDPRAAARAQHLSLSGTLTGGPEGRGGAAAAGAPGSPEGFVTMLLLLLLFLEREN